MLVHRAALRRHRWPQRAQRLLQTGPAVGRNFALTVAWSVARPRPRCRRAAGVRAPPEDQRPDRASPGRAGNIRTIAPLWGDGDGCHCGEGCKGERVRTLPTCECLMVLSTPGYAARPHIISSKSLTCSGAPPAEPKIERISRPPASAIRKRRSAPCLTSSKTRSAALMACAAPHEAADARRAVQVEIVSDAICPWCYVAKRQFERAVARLPDDVTVSVQWKPFELNPDMPPEGMDRVVYRSRK